MSRKYALWLYISIPDTQYRENTTIARSQLEFHQVDWNIFGFGF